MKAIKGLAIYAVVMGLALFGGAEAEAGPGCEITVHIINGFKKKIRITKAEIGGPAGWTTKFEGELVIEGKKKVTKTVSTGTTCNDKAGNPRKWNMRYERKNGVKHLCTNVAKESKNQLERGGACKVSNAG